MIPQHTKYQIDEYVNNYMPPGDFVRAVLSNNLMEAFMRADDINMHCMKDIMKYVYNDIPSTCHGSAEIVDLWLDTPNRNTDYENGVADPQDYPLYPMDIENVERGTMIEFWTEDAGRDGDGEFTKKYLTLHEKYEVEYVEIDSYSSRVYLKGFDNIPFNTVFFADV